ncbi:MAG: hypothetical protein HKN47_20325 [Pirellulaceae bacterium]|nr:hypothetical protein [Pirellulaceae bacterium]
MAEFFIKTEQSAVGPFTGIELREAALARILTPQSDIAPCPDGPWTKATETGLFSDKKVPLPHPPGTHVPQYHIRGLSVSAQGPFKLRELIGFTARGMVRADATLQSDLASEWIPVDRILVLKACLSGELVLLGADGKVHLRAQTTCAEDAIDGDLEHPDAKAPIEVARVSTTSQSSTSSGSFEETPLIDPSAEVTSGNKKPDSLDEDADVDLGPPPWWRRQIRWKDLNPTISRESLARSRRWVTIGLGMVILVAGIGTAFSQWSKMGLRQEHIIGNWVAEDDSFAIAFREDGNCVVFNTTGNSWSGEYEWMSRDDDEEGLTASAGISSILDELERGFELGAVKSSDGYLRLRSSAFEPTYIGNHEMSDCFLRRKNEDLMIGYPVSVDFSGSGRRMEAAWIAVKKSPPIGMDPMSDLASMEIEPPPTVGFVVERSLHVSQVVAALLRMYETGDFTESMSGRLCYSVRVDAEYLLTNYGVPDEARPLYPFELATMPNGPSFEQSQMVRYGLLKLILSDDGQIQYVSLLE